MPSVSDASGLSSWRLLVFGSDPPFIAVSQVLSRHNPQVILVEDNETSYGLQVGAIMLTGTQAY